MMDQNDDTFVVSSMMKEVDAIIAKNMTELSHEDREKSYSDIHGISDCDFDETPQLIAHSLSLMEQEIKLIQPKDAYALAESMNHEYVHNASLRLSFLRGERFSTRPAAMKFVKHFELKQFLFGTSKLVKDIEQDDLCEEDIAVLYSGYVQWSSLKDNSQRTVSIMFPLMSSNQVPVVSRTRVGFYLRMIAVEDVGFQKNGNVFVVSAADYDNGFDFDFAGWRDGAQRSGQLNEGLPGSMHGVHILFPQNGSFRSYLFSSLIKITVSVLNPLLKVRVRIHRGETMEDCMKSLQSFGINTAAIPKSPQDNEYQTQLLQNRRDLERNRRNKSAEILDDAASEEDGMETSDHADNLGEWVAGGPSRYDVILGRGTKTNVHPGNIRLRKLVDEAKPIYDRSTKREKTEIITRLVLAIQQQGRFLHESDIGWVEVSDKAAKQKVSHTFRDTGKKWKKKPST